jgi:hypothetical protein
MSTPHKHAELIKAWADGAEIQAKSENVWLDCRMPDWWPDTQYRIKPEPKPDVVMTRNISILMEPCAEEPNGLVNVGVGFGRNVRFVFDGETRKLKSVEML